MLLMLLGPPNRLPAIRTNKTPAIATAPPRIAVLRFCAKLWASPTAVRMKRKLLSPRTGPRARHARQRFSPLPSWTTVPLREMVTKTTTTTAAATTTTMTTTMTTTRRVIASSVVRERCRTAHFQQKAAQPSVCCCTVAQPHQRRRLCGRGATRQRCTGPPPLSLSSLDCLLRLGE